MTSLSEKKQILEDLFFNEEKTDKSEFLNTTLHVLSKLIPESDSGSILELQSGYYVPIASYGHDPSLIKELKFEIDKAFYLGDNIPTTSTKVYSAKIPSRANNPNIPDKAKKILEALGTLDGFYSLYAPIKIGSDVTGMISIEKFDDHFLEKDSGFILKYYALLVSEYFRSLGY